MEILVFIFTIIGIITIPLAEFITIKLSIGGIICGVLAMIVNHEISLRKLPIRYMHIWGAATALMYGELGISFFLLCVGRATGQI